MWKFPLIFLAIVFLAGTSKADETLPEIRKKGSTYFADYGAACMPHKDNNFGDVTVCLRKFRVKRPVDPITGYIENSKCYAQLKITRDGDVTKVKIKKFTGMRPLKAACRRTLFGLKFHPVRKDGALALTVSKVDFSMHYRAVKDKQVQRVGLRSRAVLGNVWDVDDSFFDQGFSRPIIALPAADVDETQHK